MSPNYNEGLALIDEAKKRLGERAPDFTLLLDIQAGIVSSLVCRIGARGWRHIGAEEVQQLQAHAQSSLDTLCKSAGITLQF